MTDLGILFDVYVIISVYATFKVCEMALTIYRASAKSAGKSRGNRRIYLHSICFCNIENLLGMISKQCKLLISLESEEQGFKMVYKGQYYTFKENCVNQLNCWLEQAKEELRYS
jgi:hypothetical protein